MKHKWPLFDRAREQLRENVFACLVLHFFKRFFSGETVSAEGDLRLGIGGILALLALPGAILPLLLLPKYSSFLRWLTGQQHFDYSTASIPDKYTFLTLTMAITGIVAVLKWDSLFPDRVDYANLAPLPITPYRTFAAKFVALMIFVGLFIFALNVSSTLLFPFVVMGDQTSMGLWLKFTTAHAVATVSGSAFMFFFFFALAGLLITVAPPQRFRQISTPVQFVSVILLVMLLFFTPGIGSLVTNGRSYQHSAIAWLPTVWFLGLYQNLSGGANGEFHALASRAMEALGTAFGASLALYAMSYRRFSGRIPEIMEAAATGPGKIWQLAGRCFDRVALRDSFDRACFHFALKTLARSQRHGLVLAGFVGLGVAVAIQDVATNPDAAARLPSATLLSAALAISFFLFTGLRFVFGVPAELSANWAFQVANKWDGAAAQRVGRKLMLMFLAPVIIGTFLTYWARYGIWMGIQHAIFALLASLLMIEALLAGFRKIPFTCSQSTGKYNLGTVAAVYGLAFFFFSPGLAYLEHGTLSFPGKVRFGVLLALLAAASIAIRYYAGKTPTDERTLVFVDEPDPVVPSMDLR